MDCEHPIAIILLRMSARQPIPRYTKQFVGLGHTLEQRKKERRTIELQQRAIANRVLFLQKQQAKAKKNYAKKKEELQQIVSVVQRQNEQQLLREQVNNERQRQLELAHEENKLRRLLHAQLQRQNQQQTQRRNSLDYERTRRTIEEAERRKEQQLQQDLLQRRIRVDSLQQQKEQGRSRIDQYFHARNHQHAQLYKDKIRREEAVRTQKQSTIKLLEDIEGGLRKRLEDSTMRVSQIEEVIGSLRQQRKQRSLSRTSLSASRHEGPTLITTIESDLLQQSGDKQKHSSHSQSPVGRHSSRFQSYRYPL